MPPEIDINEDLLGEAFKQLQQYKNDHPESDPDLGTPGEPVSADGKAGEPDPALSPPAGEGEQAGEGESPPAPPVIPELIDLGDGVQATLEELNSLWKFNQFLIDNPLMAEKIRQTLSAPMEPPIPAPSLVQEPPTPLVIPPELEEYAPLIEYIESKLKPVQSELQTLSAAQVQERQSSNDVQIRTGVELWNKQYNFTQPELDQVIAKATQMGTLPNLATQTDQFGRPVALSEATKQSLEYAFWSIPELRDRYLAAQNAEQVKAQRQQQHKEAKLGALGGGSSSAPTAPTGPLSKEQRREGMIADLAAGMGQG